MNSQPNTKVVGAFLIGFAMVAGAYVYANFGKAPVSAPAPIAQQQVATVRTPITVVDADDNGIEDWRDDFVTTDPIVFEDFEDAVYVEPDTLTGQLGINFVENLLNARSFGEVGRSEEQIITDAIGVLQKEAVHDLYDTPDVNILLDWSDQDIVNYANGAALAILNNSIPELEGELNILNDILSKEDTSRVTELTSLAEVYRQTRDDTLALPVPAIFAKQHLDLINSYHAIHEDIKAMTLSADDPAYSLTRVKRYEDDARGLAYSLQSAYLAAEPYAPLFTADDPALIFVLFSPSNFKID